jgi:hypothetical protein
MLELGFVLISDFCSLLVGILLAEKATGRENKGFGMYVSGEEYRHTNCPFFRGRRSGTTHHKKKDLGARRP